MNRILNVVFGMHYGGTEAFILNTWKNIDKEIFCFDYLYFTKNECPRDQELLIGDAKIYRILAPKLLNQLKFVYQVFNVVKKNKIKIIHSHVNELNGLIQLGSYLGGAETRISHMHFPFDSQNNNFLKNTYRRFQVKLIQMFSTNILYCSKPTYDSYNFSQKTHLKACLFNNTIDIYKFISAPKEKMKYSIDFSFPENSKIITNITRFDKSKNQKFIVEVFNNMLKLDADLILLLGGEGPQKAKIEKLVKDFGINDKVRFIGVRNDVDKILKITELYLFPSIEEGFGIVVLEAQASGTKIICSTEVPNSTDVKLSLAHYLDLTMGKDYWAKFAYSIMNSDKDNFSEDTIRFAFEKCGFDGMKQAKLIEKIYTDGKKK